MRELELEEGEAYFPQDDDDCIDPDKDLSYIDKKIENVLGHYQKDFMGGLSAESLGARYGGYGSFLPMQQRSPAILSVQRAQTQITSKSPHNLPPESFSQNSSVVSNHSFPLKSGLTSTEQALPDSRTRTMNNHDEQKKPTVHQTARKSLKLRVKMGSESVFPCNNSAIYSGLGLDMSPCSSLEDSPSDSSGCSPDMQEIKPESPSYIVKIMTSFPLPDKEILSPLHHSFVCLERKSKSNKDRKSKKKEQVKERKANKLHVKPVDFVKENHEFPTNTVTLSASKREESVTSLNKEEIKKYEVGCLEEVTEKSMEKKQVARDKAKVSSRDFAVLEKGNVKALRVKMEAENCKESRIDQRDKVEDAVLKSRFPDESCVFEKGNGMRKKTLEDQQVGRFDFATRDVKEKVHLKVKGHKPSEQKSCSQVTPSVKEQSTYLANKKKSRESQTDDKSKKDTRKDIGKKEKDPNMKEIVLGISDRKSLAFNSNPKKENLSSKKNEVVSNVGTYTEGHVSGGDFPSERVPVGDLVPPSVVEDWVQCEKCDKWRLLPPGMNPDSLPKEWICSMLTWLPGKNSCSVSEEETNDALHAIQQVPVLGLPTQNPQMSYPDGTASLHISSGFQHVDPISSGGGKNSNSGKKKINASKQNGGFEELNSGQIRSSKHQRKLIGEGDCKASTLEKKRAIEFKASEVPKKVKRVHQQSTESQNYDLGAHNFSNDFTKRSESPVTVTKARNNMTARNIEITDASRKKRKSKDQLENLTGETGHPVNRKEKKLRVSNTKCSEGISESATKSSSTMVSLKTRAKVKCSPVGSIGENTPHIKEEIRNRKSNLTRISGIENPKLEGHKNTSGSKVSRVIQEKGSLISQHKLVSENRYPKSIKGLHFHESNSEKGKSYEEEPAIRSHIPSETTVKVEPIEASSSMKKEIFQPDPTTASKEAKNVSGSGHESTGVLFQAALNFLHGASLLEPGSNEGGKYSEMTPTAAYSTSARLCEQRAHEYERCNDMASAALAYKCMEVAYMKVVYSNDFSARRDRMALDLAVRAAPLAVESPSSSASDIDSLNNQVIGGTSKDGKSVLDQQNHVIYAGNRPNFVRLLNFTQHINLAMEASRKSQGAFAAAKLALVQARKEEVIPLVKSVLDFSFHDIDGLLRLMRLAMEALNAKS